MKDELAYIQKISAACLEYLDSTELFARSTDGIERACSAFLKHKCYSIKKVEYDYSGKPIKDIQDLIDYFYGLMYKYHPGEAVYRNREQDLSIALAFVEARQEADGITKEAALKQCAALIQIVFEEEPRFKFNIPLNFSIFGQKQCGWITEVAVRIMNERIQKAKEEADLIFANAHADKFVGTGWSQEDIEAALKNLEGDFYGKEKGRKERREEKQRDRRQQS